MAKSKKKETPLMQQYNKIKAKHPDALLLFRVGDFYETFGSDAIKASNILDIVLTKRANGSASHIELAGFPHHSLDTYLPKLVRAGNRVAICDQLEEASATKSIVKRGVTELVTPGVTLNDEVLQARSNNFLMALHKNKDLYGAALLDISTGEFLITEGNKEEILKLIQNFDPKEILLQKRVKFDFLPNKLELFYLNDWSFQYDYAYEHLTKHFKTQSLKGFGIENQTEAITAAGAIFAYLEDTHHFDLAHIQKIAPIQQYDFLWMDAFTIRNLELFTTSHQEGTALIDILDETQSPMGARLLKRWLAMPLADIEQIKHRNTAVGYFLKQEILRRKLCDKIRAMADLERSCSKIATKKISPKQLAQLTDSLLILKDIQKQLEDYHQENKEAEQIQIIALDQLYELLKKALQEDPPHFIQKGNVIRSGYNEELDKLRNIKQNGQSYLNDLLDREKAKTGITSLKIDANNVFGYYLEVRNTHKDKVPEEWSRKQTLVNSERYITPELKEYEQQILGAEDKIGVLELQLFNEVLNAVLPYISSIQQNSKQVAKLDCLLNFSTIAEKYNYACPQIIVEDTLEIKEGRHPVIERQLPADKPFIANDVKLNTEDQQILMITGPNMSGKSALLRQTALIVILAQMGSYIPAESAKIGLVDKIFTRVGASDNISLGESTFMVEMNETAQILNGLTRRSLVLLDEIGRGTSTYDGISIAWAITEYLHEHPYNPKNLFATHYHELNELEGTKKKIKNFHVSIQQYGDKILFLRKLKEGGSEHSFGIHVAKIAGMPKIVTQRAEKILQELEDSRVSSTLQEKTKKLVQDDLQLSFFQLDDPILSAIRSDLESLEINTLTPVEALIKLNEIKSKLK